LVLFGRFDGTQNSKSAGVRSSVGQLRQVREVKPSFPALFSTLGDRWRMPDAHATSPTPLPAACGSKVASACIMPTSKWRLSRTAETMMITHRFLWAVLILALFAPQTAFALDWEIERNFRYFLYPSDVAAQRVARDLYVAEKGAPPTPEQLEKFMNGAAFWTTKLGEAGDLKKSWPIDWPREDSATPYQLIKQLRAAEGRPPPPPEPELDRRGWASLLVRERPQGATLTGATATCWNPVQRLHNGCAVWGDYVRAPGWIVRIFDPDVAAGQSCQWSFVGTVPAEVADPRTFVAATQRALNAGLTTVSRDCRELRIVVPSDPNDPKSVAGRAPSRGPRRTARR
jgi:hypothetical protein